MCCIFGGRNRTRESQYQISEFALKIGICRVLDFLFLIEFSSDLHSIFCDFDYGSFTSFGLLFCGLIFGTTYSNNDSVEGDGALPMQEFQQ